MWLKKLFSLLLLGVLLYPSNVQGYRKIYRKDYTYIESTQAYYKLHKTVLNWTDASVKCALEGAKLFYPDDEQEIQAVLSFWGHDDSSFGWIFIGVSDLVVKGIFETVDGISLREVYNNWRESEPNNAGGVESCVTLMKDGTFNDDSCEKKAPFICKKSQRILDWNKPCHTPKLDERRDQFFFRIDYNFIESTQAFYKFHSLPANWVDAKRFCALEGAKLFYPENEDEEYAVLSFWNDTQLSQSVFVGISDLDVKRIFKTIDGLPIEEITNNWIDIEPISGGGCISWHKSGAFNDQPCSKKFHFICKKSLRTLEWNSPCNIPNLGYTFDEVQGKCYKFHNNPMSWTDAYKACNAEQSYLAVINSEKEKNIISLRVMQTDTTKVLPNETIHLGFHKRLGRGWRTVKGTTLDNSGYERWTEGQPDGHSRGAAEKCGAMSYTGLLHDVSCDKKSFFICEHDVCTRFSQN